MLKCQSPCSVLTLSASYLPGIDIDPLSLPQYGARRVSEFNLVLVGPGFL